ncbi:DMT family transporter [Arcobacter arenosus]|uniref:DMT family transporter n=1 Tax=Arcobacter arenosus TaxID=2576037 RepID=A0A5R8XYC9_9BACT|nr:DMT family transporter [Arcobacter arenosus]TLP36330.1 DMT family transporter [Arcobacter arenosus]
MIKDVAYKYALISVFLWSTVATAFKYSLKYLSPEQLVFFASLCSLLTLLIVLLIQKKFNLIFTYIKNNTLLVLILGAINPFLYYLVLFKAYDLLPAQEAQAINYTWALMLAFLSVPFLKQKLKLKDIVAGIICYFGVLIISTKGEPFSLNFSNLDGVFLALLSTILWSLYWIFNTKSKADPVVSLFCNFLFALPMIFIYVLLTDSFEITNINGLLGAIYVGLFEMGITFLFWLKAMQTTNNTSRIANLIFISPFLSLVFIYFILKEPIYVSTLFGLLFIIFGLIIQQKKQ